MKQSAWVFASLLCACGPELTPFADGGPASHQASATLRACAEAGGGVTVDDARQLVGRINALPAPVSAACVVASLPRPLSMVASSSQLSAQPADGPTSPRIFLLGPALVLSVVPSGAGSKLIETGEWVTGTRTVKGEVELPPSGALPTDAAYARVMRTRQSTTCALCHRDEAPHETLAGAFVSTAFRPSRSREVSLAAVSALHDECVAANDEAGPCELLHALFDFGAVRQGAFRSEVPLLIE